MQNSLSLQKPFPLFFLKIVLFFAIFGMVFYLFSNFYASENPLKEVINDEKVWEEIKNLEVPAQSLDKLIQEIKGIKDKTRKPEPCEQYVLRARTAGWYACYKCPSQKVYLEAGEIWKIGKTCNNENIRYPNGQLDKRLRYEREFIGDEVQCLIVEKVKLYAYFFYPENQKRTKTLILPAGNKIFR